MFIDKKDITVLITNYNKLLFIEAACASALRNTPNVIVVDDCSTDGSFELLKSINGIKILQTPRNQGPSNANLLGVENIDTLYTVVLDGDDILLEGTVEYYIKLLNEHQVKAIKSASNRVGRSVKAKLKDKLSSKSRYFVYDSPITRYLQRPFPAPTLCAETALLRQAIDPNLFVQDLAIAANISRMTDKLIISNKITHICPDISTTAPRMGDRQLCDQISLYLSLSSYDNVVSNKYFGRYTRRIYGTLPMPDDKHVWVRGRWRVRFKRWYSRYFMLHIDYNFISCEMQKFMDKRCYK